MTTKYARGNKFADYATIADAAVDWEQIPLEEFENIQINANGLPQHPKYPDLVERAQAIYLAASVDTIRGLIRNEDGMPLPPNLMRLNRSDLAAFIKNAEKRLGAQPPLPRLADEAVGKNISEVEKLLRLDEVCELVGLKQSAIYKKMKEGKFPKNTHERPTRWAYSVVAMYISTQAIASARGTNTPVGPDSSDAEDI